MKRTTRFAALLVASLIPATAAFPCSMVLVGNCDEVVTARTMDFEVDMDTKVSIVPKGSAWGFGKTSFNYLAFDAFGMAGHGINEKGLSASLLWLNPTKYPETIPAGKKLVNVLEFVPFVLGTMSSVDEVAEFFDGGDIDFVSVPPEVKKLDLLHQHMYFVDSKGETLILEWLEGKRYMYRNESPVLVNDPPFPAQRKIWEGQLATKADIVNWEYNLIGKKMHDADTRYEMLRRLTEQSLPTKGQASMVKSFDILKRVSYMPIKPYVGDHVSWTLYSAVMVHTRDAVKVYWTDDQNDAIRGIDFNRIDWKRKAFPVQTGAMFTDMSDAVNAMR